MIYDPRVAQARILVVDDEAQLAGLITEYLERLGYAVRSAGSTKQAWALLEGGAETFALAVIDLTMPGLGGEELARRALGADANLRVLLSSGYPAGARALETEFPGRVAFLHKPFSAEMLAETVKNLLPE
jgi:DNA-binding NtrC family response regulator